MLRKSLMALTVAALFSGGAWAAVSADEAKQLGTTLTPVGAEKSGALSGPPEITASADPMAGLTSPRMRHLIDMVKSRQPAAGFDEVLVAGEPEWRAEAQRRQHGVPVSLHGTGGAWLVAAESR